MARERADQAEGDGGLGVGRARRISGEKSSTGVEGGRAGRRRRPCRGSHGDGRGGLSLQLGRADAPRRKLARGRRPSRGLQEASSDSMDFAAARRMFWSRGDELLEERACRAHARRRFSDVRSRAIWLRPRRRRRALRASRRGRTPMRAPQRLERPAEPPWSPMQGTPRSRRSHVPTRRCGSSAKLARVATPADVDVLGHACGRRAVVRPAHEAP